MPNGSRKFKKKPSVTSPDAASIDFASGSGEAMKKNKKSDLPPAVRKKVGGFTVGI